jgi:hypothetical protein
MLEFCKKQVSQLLIQPAQHYIIDAPPVTSSIDISERVCEGMYRAKDKGIDLCFILEDDDGYPADYINRFGDTSKHDFFGCEQTTYYHLANRTWQTFIHPGRSSLFLTGFRVSALKGFVFPKRDPFLDIKIWQHAEKFKRNLTKFIPSSGAVGIKGHNQGLTAGKGHKIIMQNCDPGFDWLQNNVSEEAYKFYMTL